ncbi:hypothetical protein [Pontibacter amylolyticus]|nr:hypothetical protein [Pontibacter amylolyticus]
MPSRVITTFRTSRYAALNPDMIDLYLFSSHACSSTNEETV